MSLTPEQAWEHVKALWPEAARIRKVAERQAEIEGKGGFQTFTDSIIDWPEGVDRWPMVEAKVAYREPTIADWNQECEFSDDEKTWETHKLWGFVNKDEDADLRFFGGISWWSYARIRVTPEVAPEVTPEVATCKESSPVDSVAWREVTK